MATIEDLDSRSFNDLSVDEAIELLRQIRLSRRTPKSTKKRKAKERVTKAKKVSDFKLSPEQARELLALLEED